MKPSTLWIIRAALTVQFLGVLAVPAVLAASESPRAMWVAEWLNPHVVDATAPQTPKEGRVIGVLRMRDGKLSFVEQVGQGNWDLDLAAVKRVAMTNGGRAISIVAVSGDEFVLSIMEPDLNAASPKKAASMIDRARESLALNAR